MCCQMDVCMCFRRVTCDHQHVCDLCVPQELEPGKVMWLFANTLCERTYVARKK
jgi:hypothetical protein